ncbi:hypothetical protein IMZ31_23910 (plasmid) [Pontibacillus sp. ALD_SL1]|uniref:hypothetical protein n=1 Tax=Pontibacillus sp. ALD_SL1 TaxID=2777185 RepID=UPI001A975CD1|nr:hypothetical protein [Pontibacillus sp. ALD_SL1]QST02499.1 hypothetical protein IMZ31_23910 [Pontibacillus sp. ALD_SL1]
MDKLLSKSKIILQGRCYGERFQIVRYEGLYAAYLPKKGIRTSYKETIGEAVDRGIHYMEQTEEHDFLAHYNGAAIHIMSCEANFRAILPRYDVLTSVKPTIGAAVQRAIVNIVKNQLVS